MRSDPDAEKIAQFFETALDIYECFASINATDYLEKKWVARSNPMTIQCFIRSEFMLHKGLDCATFREKRSSIILILVPGDRVFLK